MRKWARVDPPTQDQYLETVEQICKMEKLMHRKYF